MIACMRARALGQNSKSSTRAPPPDLLGRQVLTRDLHFDLVRGYQQLPLPFHSLSPLPSPFGFSAGACLRQQSPEKRNRPSPDQEAGTIACPLLKSRQTKKEDCPPTHPPAVVGPVLRAARPRGPTRPHR